MRERLGARFFRSARRSGRLDLLPDHGGDGLCSQMECTRPQRRGFGFVERLGPGGGNLVLVGLGICEWAFVCPHAQGIDLHRRKSRVSGVSNNPNRDRNRLRMPGEWNSVPRGCRTCLWPGSPFGSGSKQTGHLRGKDRSDRWCRIGIRLPLPSFPSRGFLPQCRLCRVSFVVRSGDRSRW